MHHNKQLADIKTSYSSGKLSDADALYALSRLLSRVDDFSISTNIIKLQQAIKRNRV